MSEHPVAIVTGAGSGIGRAVCELLDEQDFRLVLVGRTQATLHETASHRRRTDPLVLTANVADPQKAANIVERAVREFGSIHSLINNAGIAPMAGIVDIESDTLTDVFATNTFGPAMLLRACWPHFLQQKSGCVVNVSSMAAIDPFPGLAVYAASKSALDSLTRSIISERGDNDIVAYSVAPGAVETSMLRGLFSEADLPRTSTLDPVDVARIIVDCVLGRRIEDTGTVIPVASSPD